MAKSLSCSGYKLVHTNNEVRCKTEEQTRENDSHFFCWLDILREDNAANQQSSQIGKDKKDNLDRCRDFAH